MLNKHPKEKNLYDFYRTTNPRPSTLEPVILEANRTFTIRVFIEGVVDSVKEMIEKRKQAKVDKGVGPEF